MNSRFVKWIPEWVLKSTQKDKSVKANFNVHLVDYSSLKGCKQDKMTLSILV